MNIKEQYTDRLANNLHSLPRDKEVLSTCLNNTKPIDITYQC